MLTMVVMKVEAAYRWMAGMTCVLFIICLGLARLRWWTYIGSDCCDYTLRGWDAGQGQVVWLVAIGTVSSAVRVARFPQRFGAFVDWVVLLMAGLLLLTAAFDGPLEVMYGQYDRPLAGGRAAVATATAIFVVGVASVVAGRKARRQSGPRSHLIDDLERPRS